MRKCLIVTVAAICLGIGLAPQARAQGVSTRTAIKQLKSRQKQEWHSLKVQQQSWKQSWKGQQVTSAERTQAKHQMQRDRRNLKQQQKDALQEMKDRQRAYNSRQHF